MGDINVMEGVCPRKKITPAYVKRRRKRGIYLFLCSPPLMAVLVLPFRQTYPVPASTFCSYHRQHFQRPAFCVVVDVGVGRIHRRALMAENILRHGLGHSGIPQRGRGRVPQGMEGQLVGLPLGFRSV